MSRDRATGRASGGLEAKTRGCTVTVCRGCCCGQPKKQPIVDHAGLLTQLRAGLPTDATLRVSGCLDVCERSNVIVIAPSPAGRAVRGRPVWLGLVADPDAISDIIAWITAGGPGLADPPTALEFYAFNPPRRVRAQSGLDDAA